MDAIGGLLFAVIFLGLGGISAHSRIDYLERRVKKLEEGKK